jgi:hypothetical protein
MPSLKDMQVAIPRCDRLTRAGTSSEYTACLRPMRWTGIYTAPKPYGSWICVLHGPIMDGEEAAMRAGYLSRITVESEAAA